MAGLQEQEEARLTAERCTVLLMHGAADAQCWRICGMYSAANYLVDKEVRQKTVLEEAVQTLSTKHPQMVLKAARQVQQS